MTSRLALATTVAAIVLGHTAGASAQTYEVTKLVPGSAFHGDHGSAGNRKASKSRRWKSRRAEASRPHPVVSASRAPRFTST